MENIKKLTSFYGNQELWANAWDVSPAAVSQWVAAGEIPIKRLLSIETLTNGAFVAFIQNGKITLSGKTKKLNKEG